MKYYYRIYYADLRNMEIEINIKAEEVVFYLDLTTDFLKKKIILKGIKSFIDEKSKFHARSSYGVVIFQDRNNPVVVYDQLDYNSIASVIDEAWSKRETETSHFENGIFEILSYVFGQSAKGTNKVFRVIIISDTPSNRSEDYDSAVYDLIVKSKNFDTFIDVIRVGKEGFYKDDVKLKVITSETQGGAFYCSDSKHFLDVIGSLIKHKKEFNIVRGESDGGLVLNQDKIFYEKLAVDLITLDPGDEEVGAICGKELCPVCEAYSDELHKCYNCGSKFHTCCIASYSIHNNVGFRHIFRCPQCESLLKLDEDLVDEIYKEEFGGDVEDNLDSEDVGESTEPSKYDYDELARDEPLAPVEAPKQLTPSSDGGFKLDLSDDGELYDEEEEPVGPPLVAPVAPKAPPPPPNPPLDTKKVKVGGFFGREIEITMDPSQGSKKLPVIEPKTQEKAPLEEVKKSITVLRPPRKGRTGLKFCKICGATNSGSNICSACGATVD